MSDEMDIEILEDGSIKMLHNDAMPVEQLGKVETHRVSNVEWDNDGGGWFVQSAKTGKYLALGFKTRGEALAWEKKYFSPTGEGWKELQEDK